MTNMDDFRSKLDIFNLSDSLPQLKETIQIHQEMLQPIIQKLQQYNEISRPLREILDSTFNRLSETDLKVHVDDYRFYKTIENLGSAQFVLWEMPPQEFMDEVIESDNVNEILQVYEQEEDYQKSEEIIGQCLKHDILSPQVRLFRQTVDAYHDGHYDLTSLGLVAMIDAVLTEVSGLSTHKTEERCMAIVAKVSKEELLEAYDREIMLFYLTFEAMSTILFRSSHFDKVEPEGLNRHWIAHGRSQTEKTRLDCIKLLYFLYGIIFFRELEA